MKRSKMFVIILSLIFSVSVFAQFGSSGVNDARSMGMARTYNAVPNGIYSIGINPANLSFNNRNNFEISSVLPMPNISFKTGTDFLSLSDINYFFGGVNGEPRYLTENDKEKFNALFDNGGAVFASVNAGLFAFSVIPSKQIGAFAFSVSDFAGTKLNIPKALVDIALSGNAIGRTFNLDDADIKGWWIRNYSFTYSREIPELKFFNNFAAGVTLKLVHGYSYIGTHRNNASFTTGTSAEITGQTDLVGYSAFSQNLGVTYDFDSVSNKSSFSILPKPAGTGYGFDLGISGSITDKLSFGLALTDFGSIKWTENVAEFSSFGYVYIDDITNEDQIDSVKETVTSKSRKIDQINTDLPTAVRFGISYLFGGSDTTFPGSLLVAADYNQGFNEMPGNSKEARYSFGAEWKPMDWLPYLRTGFSFGGERDFNWAVGLGIDAGLIDLHFATSDMQSVVVPDDLKELSFSLSSRWKF